MKFLDLIQYDPIYFFSKFEKFAVVVVVLGSRDYNIRLNFSIQSNMIQFIFFSNLKSLRLIYFFFKFEKFAVVVLGSRDYNKR